MWSGVAKEGYWFEKRCLLLHFNHYLNSLFLHQGMLDFDYICSRSSASVAAMTYPFSGDHKQKFYFGHEEILMPLYKNMADAMRKHPEADTLISFASLRLQATITRIFLLIYIFKIDLYMFCSF